MWHYVQYVVRHLGSKDHWVFWYCPWQGTYLVQEGKDEWFHPVSHYVMRGDSVRYYKEGMKKKTVGHSMV